MAARGGGPGTPATGGLRSAAKEWNNTVHALGSLTKKRIWDTQNTAFDPAAADNMTWLERSARDFPEVVPESQGRGMATTGNAWVYSGGRQGHQRL